MIEFGTTYWPALLLAILAASLGIVFILYFRNKENQALTKIQTRVLVVLRFIAYFLIAFLLLSPFLKGLKKQVQNPVVIVAWDNSESIISSLDSNEIKLQIANLQNEISNELGNDYSVVNYQFGESVKLQYDLSFNDKNSDYSSMISAVNNNHFNENIGALIVVGDGIFNQGKNPVNSTGEINFPIFTIGLGDTTITTDARIENVRTNRTAFSGNRFPVEIEVSFSKLQNTPLKLTVQQEGNEIASTIIIPPNDNYFYTHEFILEAGAAGLKHFSATIEIADNENNIKNNTSGFVINILENKQKILILSHGPHPDIGAIKNTLELQTTYDVTVFTEEPFPSNFEDYNLLILNQLPSSGTSASELIQTTEKSRLPILFIVGNKSFLPQLNALNQGITITPLAGSAEEVQAILNRAYRTFTLTDEFYDILSRFPPLQAPFADYETEPEFSTLFYQRIKNIETAKPLIATGSLNGRKTGFILGEGIWRWRLFNYYFNQSQAQFNELINQLVQYLALRENEDNFIIDFNPVYNETENLIFRAEVYNDVFEPITTEEIGIKITNQNDEEFAFTFDKQNNDYYLNAGHFPIGDYHFQAEVTLENETFREEGYFTVTAVNIENIMTRANHQVMFQLASQSGGSFYLPQQINDMFEEIKENNRLKPTIYFQEMINEFLNQRWLFVVLLVLLSVEWFLRKFWGIY